MTFLSDFRIVRPPHETSQSETLDRIAAAHARARSEATGRDEARSRDAHRRLLDRYGCGPDAIATRGHELESIRYEHGDSMAPGSRDGAWPGMTDRMTLFREAVARVMPQLVPQDAPPDHLLHVTCTGYRAPNAAQECVSQRGWGGTTTVTPVYHSGCYAAFPAVRLASSLVRGGGVARIAHTELCTLHFNPKLDSAEQLVVQTLFADGHVSLRVTDEPPAGERSLEVLALREEILPDSADAMTWTPTDWGLAMTLSREVPARIRGTLGDTLSRLCADAGRDVADVTRDALHAVHPGGPRILDEVQALLGLRDEQIAASRDVLRRCGNMSSATIPHVWASMLASADRNQLILSSAFGPGLTASTGLLRVHDPAA
jgi:predicted naringenin-chalcone synthase